MAHKVLRAFVVLTLLLSNCPVCPAQQGRKGQGIDTQYIDNAINKASQQDNTDSVIKALQVALSMSTEANYRRGINVALNRIGNCYYTKADYETAIIYYSKEIFFCSTTTDSIRTYYDVSNVYRVQGDYQDAAEYCYKALGISARAKTREAQEYIINIYIGLWGLNAALKQDEKVAEYMALAEKAARQGQFEVQLVTILDNESDRYTGLGKNDSALLCLTEALAICEKNNLRILEGEVYEEFGMVYLNSGLYTKAIAYFKESIDPQKCSDDFHIISNYSSYGIALALYRMKQYNQAKDTLVNIIRSGIALHIRDNIIAEYMLLDSVYMASGDYKQALACLATVMTLKDSLTGAEKAAAINQMEVKYKTAEKDKQLSENKLLIAEQKSKIARKNTWVVSIAGGFMLILAIAGGIYMWLIYRLRTREKEGRIKILKAALDAGDNERTRIARELHDGIGGMLGASIMRFSSMYHEAPGIDGGGPYADAMSILQDMGDEIRKTAHNLMPEVLLRQSLPDAAAMFCATAADGHRSLKIGFQSFGSFDNMGQGDKLNIYRIIQELVKNVISHAHATGVAVQLMQHDDKFLLTVEDNGQGFDVMNKKEGLGLHNIQARVTTMGGQLVIESVTGKGTVVIIELPLLLTGK